MTEKFEDLGGQLSDTEPPARARGCGRPFCNHSDSHVCPWLNEDHNGRVVACGCTHERPSKEK